MKKIKQLFFTALSLACIHSAIAQDSRVIEKLTIDEFEHKLYSAGKDAQILDARSSKEFKLNHLRNAIDFSSENDLDLQKKIDLLDRKKPVFVYSIGTGRSGVLARKLIVQGFSEVYELPGGFSYWVGSGRPVVSTTGAGLSLSDYNKLVKSDKLVLVDFGSKFCPGCKKMLPVVDSVANENTSSLNVIKIEVFENKQLANDLKILALPTFIIYKGDKIIWQKSGQVAKAEFEEELKKASVSSVSENKVRE